MLRLLCLGPKNVVPPDDGGKEGIHGALAALARRADVTYAYPAGAGSPSPADPYEALNVRSVPVPFAPRESAAVRIGATLRLRPYKFAKHSTPAAVRAFAAALAGVRFDAVVCFHPHMVRLAEGVLARRGRTAPLLLREHNIEHALIESYARSLAMPWRVAAHAYAWLTRREERRLWRRVDAVAMLSDADLAAARASGVPGNFLLAPEGVPLPPVRAARWPGADAPLLLLFNPGVPQNVVNLRLFLERFWAPLRDLGGLPGTALRITGAKPAELARLVGMSEARLRGLDVQALGFVERLPELFAASLALVSPTFVGGGVRKKVLEAMAHQLPVIATPMDVRTCAFYRPGKNLLCMESARDLVAAVSRLAGTPSEWTALSEAGRRTVERHADWRRFAEVMAGEAARLVAAPRASRAGRTRRLAQETLAP